MTPLQRFVNYLMIANFLINLFSFVNLKPDLSELIHHLILNQGECQIGTACDRQL